MIIENPDEFKAWIATVCEPICDADPAALARYICALVKKDKPTEDFHKTLLSQLEVFLEEETTEFVNFLFAKLKASLKDENTYYFKVKEEIVTTEDVVSVLDISDPSKATIDANTSQMPTISLQIVEEPSIPSPTDLQLMIIDEQDPPDSLKMNGVGVIVNKTGGSHSREQIITDADIPDGPKLNGAANRPVIRAGSMTRSRERLSDSELEDKDRYATRQRNSSGSSPFRRQEKGRSRSRSWERQKSIHIRRSRSRSRRSRSRGRDRISGWRNKSPPQRRHGRKIRSWSKSPPGRSHSRSPPSKGHHYSRYKRPYSSSRSKSRHRNTSPISGSPINTGSGSPVQDNSQGEDLHRNTHMHSIVNLKDSHLSKTRCRDYEEKGFCMRGEMCPYDHGNDPVVLEDVGQVLSLSAPPPSVLEPAVPGLGMPMLQPALLHHPPHLMNRPPPNISEYNPDAPSMEPRMWTKPPFRNPGAGPMMGPPPMIPHHQRELINVHTEETEPFYSPLPFGNSNKRRCPPEFNSNDMRPPMKQRFDYGRLGLRKNNSSLHIKKIPHGLNSIAHIHNHFVKFGTIVNIQVNFGGAQDSALVTFSSHAEASAAYKSTEAVLNNRFIKVFWYNLDKDCKQENISPAVNRSVNEGRLSAKERLGSAVNNTKQDSQEIEVDNNEKVIITGSNITKTFYVQPEEVDKIGKIDAKNMVITNFHTTQELLAVKDALKKKKEKMQMNVLLTLELTQKKREFLEKLISKQEELTDKLEKKMFTPEQRAAVLSSIKELQSSIETFNNNNVSVPIAPGPSSLQLTPQLVKQSIEQTKKEILDAELDLMTKEQEGTEAAELNKTIYQLKTRAHNLGKLMKKNSVPKRFPLGRGGFSRYRTVRGQHVYNPRSTVDHRPTKLLVSGFESDDKTDIIEHFSKFGEVVEHIWDEATPALVIQYKTRKDAETAFSKGRTFQDRLMSITWFTSAQNKSTRNMRSVVLLNEDLLSEQDDEEEALRINLDANEELLLQEEDDEEDEERTWRR